MSQTEIIIPSATDLPKAAQDFLKILNHSKKVAFSGEIGAGKTSLIKEICKALGVIEQVNSPTYSIINEYSYQDAASQQEKLIHHIDLYRLNTPEEALDIGIEDYLYDENYCFIEWPGLIQSILPQDFRQINIEIFENSSRKIIFL